MAKRCVMAVRCYAQPTGASHAVVAGGGQLGLEAAYAFNKLGLKVTILGRIMTGV